MNTSTDPSPSVTATSGLSPSPTTLPLPPLRLRETRVQDVHGHDIGTFQTIVPDIFDTAVRWLTNDFADASDIKDAMADRCVWAYRQVLDEYETEEDAFTKVRGDTELWRSTLKRYRKKFQTFLPKISVILTERKWHRALAYVEPKWDHVEDPRLCITTSLLRYLEQASTLEEQHHVLWQSLVVIFHELGHLYVRYRFGKFNTPPSKRAPSRSRAGVDTKGEMLGEGGDMVELDLFGPDLLEFPTEPDYQRLLGLRLVKRSNYACLEDEKCQELNDLFYNMGLCLPPLPLRLDPHSFQRTLKGGELAQPAFVAAANTPPVRYQDLSTYPQQRSGWASLADSEATSKEDNPASQKQVSQKQIHLSQDASPCPGSDRQQRQNASDGSSSSQSSSESYPRKLFAVGSNFRVSSNLCGTREYSG